jgi:hypothetical protein
MAKSIPLRTPRQVHLLLPARRSGQVGPYLQIQAAYPADQSCAVYGYDIFCKGCRTALFRDERICWCCCAAPRGKENVYVQTYQDILACLGATCGEYSLCRRTLWAQGATWGLPQREAWWVPQWRLGPSSFRPTPQVWARPPLLSLFLWGNILRCVPALDCPRTLHWCDAGPSTPACTCVVLLLRPGRLLSHRVRVHGTLDSGSAFWIAA